MDVKQVQHGSVTVLTVAGRVDHGNAEALRAAIQPALAGPHTLVDLGGLNYISSAGLRILMLASREAKAKGTSLAICGLQPVVREIFAISRFDQVFTVYPDVSSALQAMAARR